MGRYALLVAASKFADPLIGDLRSPVQDVQELAAVLEDPAIGGFDTVHTVSDATDSDVRLAVEDTLADRFQDDLVVLYFSCHGIVDPGGELHFAASNTRHDRLASTAVSRTFLNRQLEMSRAGARVLLLDCCYSGAYVEGFKGAQGGVLDGKVGEGYWVITAADALEYAFEGDAVAFEAPQVSVFTEALVVGLRTGEADLDRDGEIRISELFQYVHDAVVRRRPKQSPRMFVHRANPHVVLARSGGVPTGGIQSQPAPCDRRATSTVRRHATYTPQQILVARGIDSVAGLVCRTLGPKGRRCVVRDQSGGYLEAADARSIVEHNSPEDPRDELGASYVRDVVQAQHRVAADGAATAVTLAQAMVSRSMDALREGANPVHLANGVRAATESVIERLYEMAKEVQTKEQIAAVVANCTADRVFGELIAEAMDKVGKEGVITVEESQTFGLELELTDGMRFDRGYISARFATDLDRMQTVLDYSYILIVNSKISAMKDMLPLLEKVVQSGKPLLIIAEDLVGETLALLLMNKALSSVAVKAPGFGIRSKAMLHDIAILTGGTVISEEAGLKLENAGLELLGRARKVVVTKDETTIVDGAGDSEQIQGRVNQLRAEIENSDSDYDREKLQERLAKLVGGVAVIQTGAASHGELEERKRGLESAVTIARIAVEHGLLPGGGAAFLALHNQHTDHGDLPPQMTELAPDEAAGAAIVFGSLTAPMLQIARNAGHDPTEIAEAATSWRFGVGFDALAGRPSDMSREGILDPARVVCMAVRCAADTVQRLLLLS